MLTETTSAASSEQDEAVGSTSELECQAPKHVCSRYLKKEPPDLYGQKHTIETPELIQDSLILLEDEIWKLPEEDQAILIRASIECPDVFESKQHRLMFLRCEQFNADVSTYFFLVVCGHDNNSLSRTNNPDGCLQIIQLLEKKNRATGRRCIRTNDIDQLA